MVSTSSLPLLDAIEAREAKREATTEAQRSAAMRDYWAAVGAIADGDPSGGSDAVGFARTLADAGVTTAQARADVEAILRCRAAVAERHRLREQRNAARSAAEAAVAAREAAKLAFDAAVRKEQQASWAFSEIQEQESRADVAIRNLAGVAADLGLRGFTGQLLPPPPPPPAPRRWQITGQLVQVGARYLKAGSVVELPPDVVLGAHDGRPVGSDVPLCLLLPGIDEPGGPVSVHPPKPAQGGVS